MTENKWTEIEHLPDWDDDIYDVYTAKKFGKWLMLKTLKEQYRDDPEYRDMFEKEFDARYNLVRSASLKPQRSISLLAYS